MTPREVAGAWLDVVLPRRCPGCGAGDQAVCRACAGRLVSGPLRRGVLVDGTAHYASVRYGPAVRRLVLASKEGRRSDVRAVLAAALSRAAVAAGWSAARTSPRLILTTPPTGARSRYRRAADPVAELAVGCAGLLRAAGADAVAVPLLRRRRPVGDQAGRGPGDRWQNVSGAFVARPTPIGPGPLAGTHPGADVVVVDDVITTGATAAECVRALVSAGWRVVGAAAVAGR